MPTRGMYRVRRSSQIGRCLVRPSIKEDLWRHGVPAVAAECVVVASGRHLCHLAAAAAASVRRRRLIFNRRHVLSVAVCPPSAGGMALPGVPWPDAARYRRGVCCYCCWDAVRLCPTDVMLIRLHCPACTQSTGRRRAYLTRKCVAKPSVTRPFLCCWRHLTNMIKWPRSLYLRLSNSSIVDDRNDCPVQIREQRKKPARLAISNSFCTVDVPIADAE